MALPPIRPSLPPTASPVQPVDRARAAQRAFFAAAAGKTEAVQAAAPTRAPTAPAKPQPAESPPAADGFPRPGSRLNIVV
jgi:hypothetical protein